MNDVVYICLFICLQTYTFGLAGVPRATAQKNIFMWTSLTTPNFKTLFRKARRFLGQRDAEEEAVVAKDNGLETVLAGQWQ